MANASLVYTIFGAVMGVVSLVMGGISLVVAVRVGHGLQEDLRGTLQAIQLSGTETRKTIAASGTETRKTIVAAHLSVKEEQPK